MSLAQKRAFGSLPYLFYFFVRRMLPATVAKLLKLQPLRHGLPVLGGRIIPFLALTALQRNDFPGHKNNSYFLRTDNQKLIADSSNPGFSSRKSLRSSAPLGRWEPRSDVVPSTARSR